MYYVLCIMYYVLYIHINNYYYTVILCYQIKSNGNKH